VLASVVLDAETGHRYMSVFLQFDHAILTFIVVEVIDYECHDRVRN
jgi:hypothetical protein